MAIQKHYAIGIPNTDKDEIAFWSGFHTAENITEAIATMGPMPDGWRVYELQKVPHRVEKRIVTKEVNDVIFE
jgi:hypothetical protein